jgi:hypothetical protein
MARKLFCDANNNSNQQEHNNNNKNNNITSLGDIIMTAAMKTVFPFFFLYSVFALCPGTLPTGRIRNSYRRQFLTCLELGPFFEEEETLNVFQTRWEGAKEARPNLPPEELPSMLMNALRFNDIPSKDAGLQAMWEFAGDITRHVFQQNREEFIESAHETANQWQTSFYGAAFFGKSWTMESPMNRVGGKDGWIATQVMKTICSDGRVRRWQWELRKNRRPPNMGSWYVDNIGSSDRKGNFEP